MADAAYPEQCGEGVTVVVATEPLDEVLRTVLGAIDEAGHVSANVKIDQELEYLSDDLCPGVEALRASIQFETSQLPTSEADHDSILEMLNVDATSYSIFVIKTNTMIPYTSVFLRLECGYWNSDKEKYLRERM